MSSLLLWVVCGLAVAGGIVGLVAGVVGTSAPAGPSLAARLRARPGKTDRDARVRRRNLLTAGAVVGALLWLVTGVFVLGVLAVLVAVGVPWLLSPTKGANVRIGRLEALGDWTQRLANVLRLGRGLDEALKVSRKGAPEPIAEEVGDTLDDVTSDKVVAALVLSASDRGPGLAQALEDLADAVHEEVAKRRAIEADRSKSRTTVRWMTFITLGVVGAGLLVPSYTAPYGTLLGQLVLALLMAGFVGVLVWMRQLAEHRPVPRFLVEDPRSRVALPSPAAPVERVEETA
ncbi:type II secretion system F family protein [Streptomyces rubiginosohelvolus]|uniref:type II secretion system F family protein n=1 Tax=Streptomyces rubiginosohelvolus TaxID=67362 RepID=UPI0035D69BAE